MKCTPERIRKVFQCGWAFPLRPPRREVVRSAPSRLGLHPLVAHLEIGLGQRALPINSFQFAQKRFRQVADVRQGTVRLIDNWFLCRLSPYCGRAIGNGRHIRFYGSIG